jgi:hypothetical protein
MDVHSGEGADPDTKIALILVLTSDAEVLLKYMHACAGRHTWTETRHYRRSLLLLDRLAKCFFQGIRRSLPAHPQKRCWSVSAHFFNRFKCGGKVCPCTTKHSVEALFLICLMPTGQLRCDELVQLCQVRAAIGMAEDGKTGKFVYTAGKPNAFIAGSTACRCEVLAFEGGDSDNTTTFRCTVRAVGRVKVKAVKHKAPFVTAVCASMKDEFIDSSLFQSVNYLQEKVEREYDACQELLRSSVKKGLTSKLKVRRTRRAA